MLAPRTVHLAAPLPVAVRQLEGGAAARPHVASERRAQLLAQDFEALVHGAYHGRHDQLRAGLNWLIDEGHSTNAQSIPLLTWRSRVAA
jgi:hypothetical protein